MQGEVSALLPYFLCLVRQEDTMVAFIDENDISNTLSYHDYASQILRPPPAQIARADGTPDDRAQRGGGSDSEAIEDLDI